MVFDDSQPVDRRAVLLGFGAAGLAVLAAACSGGSSRARPRRAPSASTPTSAGTADHPACVLAPEATEGPYYLNVDEVRSDITEGKPGTPLTLAVTVLDATSCSPVKDAAVDVWHCDAGGVYSGVEGNHATFLRGTQVSSADGIVRFTTIYPGWYPGRAVHVHVKVHAGGNVVHTGQLYFPDALTDEVFRRAPYGGRGPRDTRNEADSIFRDSGGASTTTQPVARGNGYDVATKLGVRLARA